MSRLRKFIEGTVMPIIMRTAAFFFLYLDFYLTIKGRAEGWIIPFALFSAAFAWTAAHRVEREMEDGK